MKKVLFTLLVLLSLFMFVGCAKEKEEYEKISVIMPTGTPALALANYVKEAVDTDSADVSLVAGADLLKSAFINKDKDIIVDPVNLGAMMYNIYAHPVPRQCVHLHRVLPAMDLPEYGPEQPCERE